MTPEKVISTKLRECAQQVMKRWNIPGLAFTLIVDGKCIGVEGLGTKQQDKDLSVDKNTQFRIASNSKAFSSTLLSSLIADEQCDWDDKVVTYLPEFFDQNVTIRQLLSHSSGYPAFSSSLLGFVGYTEDEIYNKLPLIQANKQPGEAFQYNSGLFLVIQKLIEKITGKKWVHLMKERIFTPLRFENVTCSVSDYCHTQNYALPHVMQGESQVCTNLSSLGDWGDSYGCASAINCSADDLSKWLLFNLKKMIINYLRFDLDSLRQIIIKLPEPAEMNAFDEYCPLVGYGMGWFIGKFKHPELQKVLTSVEHPGGEPGFSSLVAMIPELNIGFACVCNKMSMRLPLNALKMIFFELALSLKLRNWVQLAADLEELYDKSYRELRSNYYPIRPMPQPIKRFCGSYDNDYIGRITIKAEDQNLYLVLGPNGSKIQLRYIGDNQFCFCSYTEDLEQVYHPSIVTLSDEKLKLKLYLDNKRGGRMEAGDFFFNIQLKVRFR